MTTQPLTSEYEKKPGKAEQELRGESLVKEYGDLNRYIDWCIPEEYRGDLKAAVTAHTDEMVKEAKDHTIVTILGEMKDTEFKGLLDHLREMSKMLEVLESLPKTQAARRKRLAPQINPVPHGKMRSMNATNKEKKGE